MPIIEGALQRGVAKFQYDFAIEGGTVSNITLRGIPIPSKAIIFDGILDIITPLTGGAGASCAITSGQGAADLIADAVVTGEPWSVAELENIVPVGSEGTALKMTAVRIPKLAVTVNALTAGKFNLFLSYFLSD